MLISAHDNAKFASSGGDRSVFVWDVATAKTIRRILGHRGKINAVEFNYDASVVVSGNLFETPLSSLFDTWKVRTTLKYGCGIFEPRHGNLSRY